MVVAVVPSSHTYWRVKGDDSCSTQWLSQSRSSTSIACVLLLSLALWLRPLYLNSSARVRRLWGGHGAGLATSAPARIPPREMGKRNQKIWFALAPPTFSSASPCPKPLPTICPFFFCFPSALTKRTKYRLQRPRLESVTGRLQKAPLCPSRC